jgi:predicted branched-subunit amino acid permease
LTTSEATGPPEATTWEAVRSRVLRNASGVGVAVGAYGVSYGALGVASGLSVVQTCALSVLAFTGGSQFALLGVLGSGGSPVSGTATALLLGSRNTMYGLRLATLLRARGVRRFAAAQLTIDETTAMSLGQDERAFDGRAARLAFWSTGLAVFSLWNLATVVGALGASALGDPKSLGLDAAVGAAFLGLLWPRLRERVTWVVALAGAAVALALTPFLTPGVPVLAAGLVAVVAGLADTTEAAAAEADDALRQDGAP